MGMGKGSLNGGSIFRQFTSYPRCDIFSCPRQRGCSFRCCFFCPRKGECEEKCLNNPAVCGRCLVPDKGRNVMRYALGNMDLPDHPDIRKMELYGTLHPEEEEGPEPICPVCQEECETIYLDANGDCCGCNLCVKTMDAWEYTRKAQE